MYKNKFIEKLKQGLELCTVAQIEEGLAIAEMAGLSGFDAVLLDCEHTASSQETVVNFVRACECGGAVPFVRTRELNQELVLRYLDAGVMGILFPNICTAEDAQKAVDAVKFPPLGKRGLSCTRSFDYGLKYRYDEYIAFSNDETAVMLMIETPEACENIEAILDVPGITTIELGTTDLSLRLGCPGDRDNPILLKALDRVMRAAKLRKIPVGSVMRKNMSVQEELKKGYGVMTYCVPDQICKDMTYFIDCVRGDWIR